MVLLEAARRPWRISELTERCNHRRRCFATPCSITSPCRQDLPPAEYAGWPSQMFAIITAIFGLASFALVLALIEQVWRPLYPPAAAGRVQHLCMPSCTVCPCSKQREQAQQALAACCML